MTEREEIKQLKHRRRQKKIGVICFLLAVLSVAMILCVAMFFNIEEITVVGAQRYNDSLIIAYSGVTPDQNIFAIDTKKAAAQIKEELYYLESVRVVRRLPTTIEIRVVESEPAFIVADAANHYTLLSGQYRIIEHAEGVFEEPLPVLIGLDLSECPAGTYADEYLPEKMETLQNIRDAIAESEMDLICYIDLSDTLSSVLLYDNRVLIELGSELELTRKLMDAKVILEDYKDEDAVGTLNMSVIGKGYFKTADIDVLMSPVYMESYFKYG